MSLKERMRKYPTVKREDCSGCGNPWYFDQGEQGFVCTTCYKVRKKPVSDKGPASDSREVEPGKGSKEE